MQVQDETSPQGLLAGYRVLDLADEKGAYCGRVLGDLGADVIKVEQPGGDPARALGPFYRAQEHPEKSLWWFFHNANKRGITLDIRSDEGRGLLRRLLRDTDLLIESFGPGVMAELGLGYDDLAAINPRLVMVAISHFGESGPYRDYLGSDLVDMCMGGYAYVVGYSDGPPMRIAAPHAYTQAGAQAATGAMTALYEAQLSGRGQHVDVSIQECIINTMNNTVASADITGTIIRRGGAGGAAGGGQRRRNLPGLWPCKDGHVNYMVSGAGPVTNNVEALVAWMDEEGMADVAKRYDLDKMGPQEMAALSEEEMTRLEGEFARFFASHTKQQLWEGAVQRRMLLAPENSPRDLLEMEHLRAREAFQPVFHPELGEELTYPGPFVKIPGAPISIRRRAPLIGEHNEEIYVEGLGLSADELNALQEAGVV